MLEIVSRFLRWVIKCTIGWRRRYQSTTSRTQRLTSECEEREFNVPKSSYAMHTALRLPLIPVLIPVSYSAVSRPSKRAVAYIRLHEKGLSGLLGVDVVPRMCPIPRCLVIFESADTTITQPATGICSYKRSCPLGVPERMWTQDVLRGSRGMCVGYGKS